MVKKDGMILEQISLQERRRGRKKPLSTRKYGMIIRCICHHHKGCNQTKDGETTTQIYLNSIKSSGVDDANAKILAAL